MADYTLKNLGDVKDSAPEFGLAPAMSARFAGEALDAERTGISLHELKPGEKQPFGHTHVEAEEVYVVLAGSGQIKLGDDLVDVGPMDAIRVAPTVLRALAAGPDGLQWLAVGPHVEGDGDMDPEVWSESD